MIWIYITCQMKPVKNFNMAEEEAHKLHPALPEELLKLMDAGKSEFIFFWIVALLQWMAL